jgi:hypothetical protein
MIFAIFGSFHLISSRLQNTALLRYFLIAQGNNFRFLNHFRILSCRPYFVHRLGYILNLLSLPHSLLRHPLHLARFGSFRRIAPTNLHHFDPFQV